MTWRNSNEHFLSAFGDHRELVPSMAKCGCPGSDTHATRLPCAWPLHPHVFHMHVAISVFFLASSRHIFQKRFLRKGSWCMFRKELSPAVIIKAKLTVWRVHFPCSQACQSLAWGREQEDRCWGLLHGAAGMAALELLGKVTPGRLMAWKVHSLQIAPFPNLTLLLSSGVDNASWHLGCDRKIDAFSCIGYYSWINKFEKKRTKPNPTFWE